MRSCLLLNATYEPLKIISWQSAVVMYFNEKVSIVEEDSAPLRSPSVAMRMPSVVALKKYCRLNKKVKFSRKNILIRDNFTCQYCGTVEGDLHPVTKEKVFINVDHIVPRSRGGITSWKNCVASCQVCNNRKGDRPLYETEMALRRKPRAPQFVTFQLAKKRRQVPEKWLKWCFTDSAISYHWEGDDGEERERGAGRA